MPRELDLDERLKLAASFVRPGAVFADVGCDHGRLSVYLMQQQGAKRGFACDIRPQPLEKARQLIARKGLSEQITPVLTDGLVGMEGRGITDVIVAGIGGEVLAHVVEEAPFLKDPAVRIILQPQSKEHILRKTLCRLGYRIEEEHCVHSGRFLYTVMVVSYCGREWEADDFFAYTGLLTCDPDENKKEKLRRTAATLREIAANLKNSPEKQQEYIQLEELAERISVSAL
ncbi:MAG: SAM-dependent methyltransferase [Oscillospiraceae bacterium]|nr:SAM-dependent methyltransferase [Oscillospiraceae bacterium]